MITRCKFRCTKVEKQASGNMEPGKEFAYVAYFEVVTCGSKENDEFFMWTPFGELRMGALRDDKFIPGKEYYLDISAA